MIYRLPFQDLQTAVIARLRSDLPGVNVVPELRLHKQLPAKFVSVGMGDAIPDHAYDLQLYQVQVMIYACKTDPEGSGHDPEIYALADSIVQAMTTPLDISGGWAFITPPWYESAVPTLVERQGGLTAQIALTYRITVQKLPDTP
jgi:hypothetical protein